MNEEVKLYWSRAPGRFVKKYTGEDLVKNNKTEKRLELECIKEYILEEVQPKTVVKVFQEVEKEVAPLFSGPMFVGNVREWYETLVESIIDAANTLEIKTKCRATRVVASPDIATILEHTCAYRAKYVLDNNGKIEENRYQPKKLNEMVMEEIGSLNNRFEVYKDFNQLVDELYVLVFNPEKPLELLAKATVKVLDLVVI